MDTLLMRMNSRLGWLLQTTSLTESLWIIIGLLATGWFLSTLRRA